MDRMYDKDKAQAFFLLRQIFKSKWIEADV